MEVEGSKRVEVAGKDGKKQITAVLGGSCVGDFLPPKMIYEGKTPRCLPNHDFPENGMLLTQLITGLMRQQ